jgi:phospholipase A2
MTNLNGKGVLPVPTRDQLDQIMYNLEVKKAFQQPLNSVDLWCALIVNKLFAPRAKRQNQYLSEQQKYMDDGQQLFPIYTAVQPLGDLKYHWFEFTPYEIGSVDVQAFVPTWAFGRPFRDGKSLGVQSGGQTEYAPEQVFGFYLGIFGSAYTVNFTEMLNMMRQAGESDSDVASQKLKMNMLSGFARAAWGVDDMHNQRLSPASVYNLTYQMAGRKLSDQEKITLIDAGLDFNLPLPPLLRPERALDVIFVFDSSADIGKAGELRKAEADARRRGLKFPQIDYNQAQSQAMSVFRDPADATVPTIIYLPLIKDTSLPAVRDNSMLADFDPKACTADGYCNTFNFEYPKDGFEKLTLLTQLNLEANVELIRKTLLDVLELKYR